MKVRQAVFVGDGRTIDSYPMVVWSQACCSLGFSNRVCSPKRWVLVPGAAAQPVWQLWSPTAAERGKINRKKFRVSFTVYQSITVFLSKFVLGWQGVQYHGRGEGRLVQSSMPF